MAEAAEQDAKIVWQGRPLFSTNQLFSLKHRQDLLEDCPPEDIQEMSDTVLSTLNKTSGERSPLAHGEALITSPSQTPMRRSVGLKVPLSPLFCLSLRGVSRSVLQVLVGRFTLWALSAEVGRLRTMQTLWCRTQPGAFFVAKQAQQWHCPCRRALGLSGIESGLLGPRLASA